MTIQPVSDTESTKKESQMLLKLLSKYEQLNKRLTETFEKTNRQEKEIQNVKSLNFKYLEIIADLTERIDQLESRFSLVLGSENQGSDKKKPSKNKKYTQDFASPITDKYQTPIKDSLDFLSPTLRDFDRLDI
jgi:hypothetical protein